MSSVVYLTIIHHLLSMVPWVLSLDLWYKIWNIMYLLNFINITNNKFLWYLLEWIKIWYFWCGGFFLNFLYFINLWTHFCKATFKLKSFTAFGEKYFQHNGYRKFTQSSFGHSNYDQQLTKEGLWKYRWLKSKNLDKTKTLATIRVNL
jgi:hypothetical protein